MNHADYPTEPTLLEAVLTMVDIDQPSRLSKDNVKTGIRGIQGGDGW